MTPTEQQWRPAIPAMEPQYLQCKFRKPYPQKVGMVKERAGISKVSRWCISHAGTDGSKDSVGFARIGRLDRLSAECKNLQAQRCNQKPKTCGENPAMQNRAPSRIKFGWEPLGLAVCSHQRWSEFPF